MLVRPLAASASPCYSETADWNVVLGTSGSLQPDSNRSSALSWCKVTRMRTLIYETTNTGLSLVTALMFPLNTNEIPRLIKFSVTHYYWLPHLIHKASVRLRCFVSVVKAFICFPFSLTPNKTAAVSQNLPKSRPYKFTVTILVPHIPRLK
jgi:hypothetical protein